MPVPVNVGPNARVPIEVAPALGIDQPRTLTSNQDGGLIIVSPPPRVLGKGVPAMKLVPLFPLGKITTHRSRLSTTISFIKFFEESIDFLNELPGTAPPLVLSPEDVPQGTPLVLRDGIVGLPILFALELRREPPGRGMVRGPIKADTFIATLPPGVPLHVPLA
jgi:hypothetical protein